MEQDMLLSVKVSRETYDALVARQKASPVDVSLSAIVRQMLGEALGVKRKNGRVRK